MDKYSWSRLNTQQVGAYAEYFVKMELTMYGFQVYTTDHTGLVINSGGGQSGYGKAQGESAPQGAILVPVFWCQ